MTTQIGVVWCYDRSFYGGGRKTDHHILHYWSKSKSEHIPPTHLTKPSTPSNRFEELEIHIKKILINQTLVQVPSSEGASSHAPLPPSTDSYSLWGSRRFLLPTALVYPDLSSLYHRIRISIRPTSFPSLLFDQLPQYMSYVNLIDLITTIELSPFPPQLKRYPVQTSAFFILWAHPTGTRIQTVCPRPTMRVVLLDAMGNALFRPILLDVDCMFYPHMSRFQVLFYYD